MIVVLHHSNKDPEIFFDVNEAAEKRILKTAKQMGMIVERCSPEEWPGQDKKNYAVHHFNVKKKKEIR